MLESKVIIKNNPPFPLIARSRDTGQCILFTGNITGTVIVKGDNTLDPIGYWDDRWVPVGTCSTWEILPTGSSVTITVE